MEITYYGSNCIKLATKKVAVVIDDTIDKGNAVAQKDDIVIATNKVIKRHDKGRFVINSPGEYEVSEVSVHGIASHLHFDEAALSTLYAIHMNGYSIAVIGHSVGKLSEAQLEALGVVDILIIPVGGHGYTLDAVAASALIKEIEPKMVIPTHYDDSVTAYEVAQAPLSEFLKVYGGSDQEQIPSLKLKDPILSEKTQVVTLVTKSV